MKRGFLPLTMLVVLTACSSNNRDKQVANDSYEKNANSPTFVALNSGGVHLPTPDPTYQLPTTHVTKGPSVDIRPPSEPIAIISGSITQFDGERSLIIYPQEKRVVYNLLQIERLLTEKNIKFSIETNRIQTDWTSTGRLDDIGDTQIRYTIEEIGNTRENVLAVSVLEMKRNNIIFTPTITDKQRYASDRLNQLIGELNTAYRIQQQQLTTNLIDMPIQSSMVTNISGRTGLLLNAEFNQSWLKLASALPSLGFDIKEENPARGYRELRYKAINEQEWLRLGVNRPNLKKGKYHMQLSADGKQSAVVLSNKDNEALSGEEAQLVYQALQAILAK